jgi:hypothetical protein
MHIASPSAAITAISVERISANREGCFGVACKALDDDVDSLSSVIAVDCNLTSSIYLPSIFL